MHLEFFGAAGEVTGSCHILHAGGQRILLDCGMIQGGRRDEARNRDPFPFDAADIDAVVLSHAHIDHSGRLPLLVKRGYRGPIHAQEATRDLARILLKDAASLGEKDTETENRKRARKGLPPIEPLYGADDAEAACELLDGMRYRELREIADGVTLGFHDAGHILGSCAVELRVREKGREVCVVFSGDLGQYGTPILHDPESLERADLVLMECTYGDRRHRDRAATVVELGEIVATAGKQHGSVLIPAFAVGRSQELLYHFGKHFDAWQLGRWQIFLDSPMAIEATRVYWDYPQLYDAEATRLRADHDDMPLLPNLVMSRSADESRRINEVEHRAIVIAGSGMCTGGRILHHFKHRLWRPETHVLIIGYQARGSLGRRLVDGADYVRIHHETIKVQAQVHTLGGFSAHGDQQDLLRWYRNFRTRPPVCLVHGEARAAEPFAAQLEDVGARWVHRARPGQVIDLQALDNGPGG